MENRILGLHHITAIAGKAKTNLDFYTKVLGLRLLKKTVNFDDPGPTISIMAMKKAVPVPFLLFFLTKAPAGVGQEPVWQPRSGIRCRKEALISG